MARQWTTMIGTVITETGTEEWTTWRGTVFNEDQEELFSVTVFNTDSGALIKVIALMETHLETIDTTKVLHLVDIERLAPGGYRGTIIYDT